MPASSGYIYSHLTWFDVTAKSQSPKARRADGRASDFKDLMTAEQVIRNPACGNLHNLSCFSLELREASTSYIGTTTDVD